MEGMQWGQKRLFWPAMGQESSFRTPGGGRDGELSADTWPGAKRLRGLSLQGSGPALGEQDQPRDGGRAAQHFEVQVTMLRVGS